LQIEQIRTKPDPYKPYLLSQAIRVGELLFVSGQRPSATTARSMGTAILTARRRRLSQISSGHCEPAFKPQPRRKSDHLLDEHDELFENHRITATLVFPAVSG